MYFENQEIASYCQKNAALSNHPHLKSPVTNREGLIYYVGHHIHLFLLAEINAIKRAVFSTITIMCYVQLVGPYTELQVIFSSTCNKSKFISGCVCMCNVCDEQSRFSQCVVILTLTKLRHLVVGIYA